jgi:hypothetical protein
MSKRNVPNNLLRSARCAASLLVLLLAKTGIAQQALTWQQIKDRFEAANPTMKADQINVQEM